MPVESTTSRSADGQPLPRPHGSPATSGGLIGFLAHPATAWSVLAASLALTLLAWFLSNRSMSGRARDRFRFETEEIQAAIDQRMIEYQQVLRGGVGLFAGASGQVTREQWRRYVGALRLAEYWPGILGLGVSVRIAPADLEAFVRGIRAEGFPDFVLYPEGPRSEYHAIVYLEPFRGRNLRAFGYDMFSEPVRREAMERARDTGEPCVSGIVTLVQETGVDLQRGFLVYLPYYGAEGVPATEEERRGRLQAFIYAPFRIKDFMRGIVGAGEPRVHFEVFDGPEIAREAFLYSSDDRGHLDGTAGESSGFVRTLSLPLPGHEWTLYFRSRDGFLSAAETNQPLFVACAGFVVDLALFLIVLSLGKSRQRALAVAESTAAELAAREEAHRERALATESEGRFRILADHAPVLVWMSDPDGRCVYFNRPWLEFTGRSLEEQLADGRAAGVHPDDLDAFRAAMSAAVETHGPLAILYRRRRSDGAFRWVMDRGVSRFDGDGGFVGYVGSCVDVTDFRDTEAALRASEARIQAVLDSAIDGIVTMDQEGRIMGFNPAAERIFGWKASDVKGRKLADVIIPETLREAHRRGLARYLATGEGSVLNRRIEVPGLRSDGTELPLELSITQLPGPGAPVFTGFVRDITERKKAEEALRQANETLEARVSERTAELQAAKERAEAADAAKTTFLATMSHELRTPLNAIIGFAGTLLMRLPGPLNTDQENQLRTVQTNGRHLLALINDLLDLAKIESGKVQLTLEPVECRRVVQDAAAVVQASAQAKGLDLVVEVPEHEVEIHTDQRALNQILINLLGNAVKFTEQGSVQLVLQQRRAGARTITHFLVSDTGIGIGPDDQGRLFSAFSQVGRRGVGRRDGVGLGLYLSQKLAGLLGGSISVESESGRGSRFCLVLETNEP